MVHRRARRRSAGCACTRAVTPSGGSTRHRSQPARCRAFTDCSCVAGTCSTTSPAWFSPPVSSRSTSQALQPAPFHASQTSGGLRGSTPTPPTGQSIRSSTAHDGTAADSPISMRLAGRGHRRRSRHVGAPRRAAGCGRSIAPSLVTAAKLLNSHGTIGRSATVVKTTGSSTSVRGVATSVSARTSTVAGCGGREPERRGAARGRRRVELHADQLEELDVVPVRDPVQPVDQLVDHLGERLDQRDARVADVVVGPVGRALLHQALGVVDQRLEVAVVEVRGGQDHVSSRPSALPTRLRSARAAG